MARKQSFLFKINQLSEAKKLLVFLLTFAVIAGGYMAYRSLAGPSATAAAIKAHAVIRDKFPKARSLGMLVCNLERESQHSYGNAEDWAAYKDGNLYRTYMQDIANYLVSHRGALKVKNVIYNGRIWSNGSWKDYSGTSEHKDHVHVDFEPTQTGKKKC